jgi:predicted Zn-dependent protease
VAARPRDAPRAQEARVITRRELLNVLGRRRLADWVLVEREQDLASVDEHTRVKRAERRVLWQLTVHFDSPAGRGSSYVTIDAVDGAADAAVDQAIALAQASIGPAWLSRSLAAPARVKLEDASLEKRTTIDISAGIAKNVARPADVSARVSVLRENVNLVARQGLRTAWTATLLRADALVISGKHSLLVEREARQLSALDLDGALGQAKHDLDLLAKAGAPSGGACVLVFRADALLHDGLGVWAAFASQADAVVERQGLTRYRERTPIAPGAEQVAEPLTITSNGAIDFGVLSAPLGDHGDAVRTFKLVERGVAAGLGLTPREGALRGRDPNGGVRNLEVATGSWSGAIEAAGARVVEVRRLRSLSIDPYTGDASLEIELGVEHGKSAAKPFRGGSIRIDLIDALAKAKRSATEITRGAYKGPDAVLIERAEIIA